QKKRVQRKFHHQKTRIQRKKIRI
ncbi:uncharacterized protein METZ01_LOCUS159198, partial [marine metagenome]